MESGEGAPAPARDMCYAPGGTPRVYIEERGKQRTLLTRSLSHTCWYFYYGEITADPQTPRCAVAARVFSGTHRTTAGDAVGPRCTSLSRSRNPYLRAACVRK